MIKFPANFKDLKVSHFRKVSRVAKTGCWLWKGKTTAAGYARKSIEGETYYLHRVVKLVEGSMSRSEFLNPKLVCRHRCDTPRCLNPKHILLGTQLDNVADRDSRNRVRHGERHPNAKLSLRDVIEIRKLLVAGEVPKQLIAWMYEVSPANIWAIRTGYSRNRDL